MKYIRTKDGIYDTNTMSVSSLYDNGHFVKNVSYCKRIDDFTLLNIYESDIVKQADTIEELCDEFVRVSKSVHDFLVSDDIPTKKFDDTEIYGAIWTDRGLIYVAKMNNKGELELL